MIFSTAKLFNAGLGNLLIPLSKAYLASRSLDCRLLVPFQIDTRRMRNYFNPAKMGYLPYLPNPLKKITFSFEDYKSIRKISNTNDYYENIKTFIKVNRYNNIILINEGMWGGYYSIYRARKWIKTFLVSDRNARKNIAETGSHFHPKRIQVGIHIRKGDFQKSNESLQESKTQSMWNVQIPIEWYYNIAQKLLEEFKAENIDFILFTDSERNPEINEFIKSFNIITSINKKGSAFSDLYSMSECDLLVCANSSYSMMGAFLTDSPYLMFKEYVIKKDGKYFLWDEDIYDYDHFHEKDNPRGTLIGNNEKINEKLLLYLESKIRGKKSIHNELIFGGKYED